MLPWTGRISSSWASRAGVCCAMSETPSIAAAAAPAIRLSERMASERVKKPRTTQKPLNPQRKMLLIRFPSRAAMRLLLAAARGARAARFDLFLDLRIHRLGARGDHTPRDVVPVREVLHIFRVLRR